MESRYGCALVPRWVLLGMHQGRTMTRGDRAMELTSRHGPGAGGRSGGQRPRGAGNGGLTRRRLLTVALPAAAGAATAVAAPGALRVVRAAAPVAGSGRITLIFNPQHYVGAANVDTINSIIDSNLEPFRARHPSIRVVLQNVNMPQELFISSVLAGDAPDVVHIWYFSALVQGGYLYDIGPMVKQDNVDLSLFSSTQLARYYYNGGFYGLPMYLGTFAIQANLGMLNQLGLKTPAADWTYRDWEDIIRATSDPGRKTVGALGFPSVFQSEYIYRGFGGSIVDPQQATRCGLDQNGSLQCTTWVQAMNDVLAPALGVATAGQGDPFAAGRAATQVQGIWGVVFSLPALQGLDWNFLPMPAWPDGPTCFATSDLWGIAANTKYPQAAFELVKYVATEPYFPRMFTQGWLLTPALKTIWPDWLQQVKAVVPFARDKNWEAFSQLPLTNRAYTHAPFKYNSVEAYNLLAPFATAVASHKLSVVEASAQATKQVDAFEALGPKTNAAFSSSLAALQKEAVVRAFPPPPLTGQGRAPSHLPKGYFTPTPGGAYTLIGDGADVWNPTTNCVFAGSANTAARAAFVCRVTALENVNCPHLSQWAKVGLLAAANLSDVAPALTLEVTGGNGINQQVQVSTSLGWTSQGPASPQERSGLVAPAYLTRTNTLRESNGLLAPVWLKLERDGLAWTTYTSFDGVTWTQAGPRVVVEMAGAWVGLFATAHNASFQGKGQIRAAFDHVSFPVTGAWQIGLA